MEEKTEKVKEVNISSKLIFNCVRCLFSLGQLKISKFYCSHAQLLNNSKSCYRIT